jgi:hypothetical protein
LSERFRRIEYIADLDRASLTDGLVMFFNSMNIAEIASCDPKDFVRELAVRWRKRRGETKTAANTALEPVSKPTKNN